MSDWRTTWDIIVPGEFSGSAYNDVLLYSRSLGTAQFHTATLDPFEKYKITRLELLKSHDGAWRKTRDEIIPGEWGRDGYTDLFLYDRAAGQGAIHLSDGQGGITLLRRHTDLRKTWNVIVAADLTGTARSDLLFYERASGLIEFYSVDKDGGLNSEKAQVGNADWDVILPGQFGGDGPGDDLLFYSRARGTGAFYTLDPRADGLGVIGQFHGERNKDWDQIVPLTFA